jgi:molybdenum cofactor guanylyltransferase
LWRFRIEVRWYKVNTASHIAGFILAGGRSSRMGRDKAMLEIDGVTMMDRAIDLLRRVGIEPAVVGSFDESSLRVGVPVIPDDWPGAGPLGGIATALRYSQTPWNLVIACDTPYLTTEWLEFLKDRACATFQAEQRPAETTSGAEAPSQQTTLMSELKLRAPKNPTSSVDAVVPMNEDGAEPLCAMYNKSAEAAIWGALENGTRKVTDGLAKLRVDCIERAEWKGFDSDGFLFKNMNEPADYAEAKARLGGRAKK